MPFVRFRNLNIMTFCAGGIVLESTQKPGGNPAGKGGGTGAGGTGGAGAGGVGGGAGVVGGVGAGDVVGGVTVDTVASGTLAPGPHPNRKNPGISKKKVAALTRIFIPLPVVSRVNAAKTQFTPVEVEAARRFSIHQSLQRSKPVLALKACHAVECEYAHHRNHSSH
jgi:hypothetical protein